MPRTPAKFTQADVARALRAIEQTGVKMEVVLELDGRIRIIPRGDTPTPAPAHKQSDEFDYPGDIRL